MSHHEGPSRIKFNLKSKPDAPEKSFTNISNIQCVIVPEVFEERLLLEHVFQQPYLSTFRACYQIFFGKAHHQFLHHLPIILADDLTSDKSSNEPEIHQPFSKKLLII